MRNKYYFGDVYKLEDDLFYNHETMIEYVRENWQDYCVPIGEDAALIMMQDNDGTLTLTYSVRNEDGQLETDNYKTTWETVQMTWLVSELDRMVARV